MNEEQIRHFSGMSPQLMKTLAEELEKEDPDTDTEIATAQAMQRIAQRINQGETGLYDPSEPSDLLAIILSQG